MTDTMRALIGGIGPHWQIRERPVPQPGPGEVLIRTVAVATNNADIGMLAESDPINGGHGREFIAGFEYAGEIAAVGEGVDTWATGDAVMGSTPSSFAEYTIADHRFVLPIPEGVDPATACALPTGLLTEHGSLVKAGFTTGQSVLVTGASTGIGLIGAQMAKALGASQVIGTTRSADKRELLTAVGVDTTVITSEADLTEAVLAATGGQGVDVVLDHVAGQTFAQCLPATKHDGHIVNIGRLAGPASTIGIDHLSYRHLTVHGVSFGFTRTREMSTVIAGLLPQVMPAVARGDIRPVIDQTLPWTEHAKASGLLRAGGLRGKIVMTLTGA
ncbi:zinc-binding dehydrogenase [Streptomyces sp. SID10853]|uniref:quinone oxidoreductase family protein n=1 Tax=Streptomyces sp. SID10853 TaxID=2706028 RepID=UPI0013BFBB51|nr:zinc-binding dehydrogenase [Streptomyces sp. SID10853]NDZ78239.1 zinc-binding dehydrogenase [Streptomyces sp. SID10853]